MKELTSYGSLENFFSRIGEANALLLLDYDGTLSPFHIDPSQAFPYPGVVERIRQLMSLSRTRVIIVSGRSVDDLIPLLSLDSLPEIWGCHGGERLIDGRKQVRTLLPVQQEALLKGKQIAEQYVPKGRCEQKPLSIAAHWRGVEPSLQQQIRQQIEPLWKELAEKSELEANLFDGGIEMRVKGMNKGGAIETILKEYAADAVAYLGDDATDEEAFAALGERGLKVLVRSELRETLADIQLLPPDELLDFFDKWIDNGK